MKLSKMGTMIVVIAMVAMFTVSCFDQEQGDLELGQEEDLPWYYNSERFHSNSKTMVEFADGASREITHSMIYELTFNYEDPHEDQKPPADKYGSLVAFEREVVRPHIKECMENAARLFDADDLRHEESRRDFSVMVTNQVIYGAFISNAEGLAIDAGGSYVFGNTPIYDNGFAIKESFVIAPMS